MHAPFNFLARYFSQIFFLIFPLAPSQSISLTRALMYTFLIFQILLHIYHQIANLLEKIEKNCWNLAPVAPMPQKVTGARHPWYPSLRGPCKFDSRNHTASKLIHHFQTSEPDRYRPDQSPPWPRKHFVVFRGFLCTAQR